MKEQKRYRRAPVDDRPAVPSGRDPILSSLTNITAELASLKMVVEKRLIYDRAKEKAFDHLYQELEGFKRDAAYQEKRPMLIDLILLYDRMEVIYRDVRSATNVPASVADLLQTLSDELLEILYRREVEMITSSTPVFDPRWQRAIGAETTNIPSEDNKVVQVVRRGFRYRHTILRPEEVIIRKYQPQEGRMSRRRGQ